MKKKVKPTHHTEEARRFYHCINTMTDDRKDAEKVVKKKKEEKR